uniref:Latent-transforming growth factor beta-binding protein 3-like n=1 Tax=Ailuropoda melanoleuca TaxID=9646 RepID=A0A7N5K2Q6_AILME
MPPTQETEIDICKLNRNFCRHGECIPTRTGHACQCYQGYRSHPQHRYCVDDIDECLDSGTCPDGRCENKPGSYKCIPCQPGFRAQNGICSDVDECSEDAACKHGWCENVAGSFRCSCGEGFVPAPDFRSCCIPTSKIDKVTDRRDVCWQLRGEDGMCSSPFGGQQLTYEECCCRHGKGWGYHCHACPPRSPGFNCQSAPSESNSFWDFSTPFGEVHKDADSSEEDSDECRCLNGRCVRTQQASVCESSRCPPLETGYAAGSTFFFCLSSARQFSLY